MKENVHTARRSAPLSVCVPASLLLTNISLCKRLTNDWSRLFFPINTPISIANSSFLRCNEFSLSLASLYEFALSCACCIKKDEDSRRLLISQDDFDLSRRIIDLWLIIEIWYRSWMTLTRSAILKRSSWESSNWIKMEDGNQVSRICPQNLLVAPFLYLLLCWCVFVGFCYRDLKKVLCTSSVLVNR